MGEFAVQRLKFQKIQHFALRLKCTVPRDLVKFFNYRRV